jgi:hypothetical protein
LFRQDATFCAQRGTDPGTVRLTSSNYPNRFVRLRSNHFQLDIGQADSGFVEDTSFTLVTA